MKKLLCMIAALVMTISMSIIPASAAVYPDISDSYCETAVTVLSALNVINGYEDGTYRPDQTVNRAEMAKLMVCVLGKASQAASTTPATPTFTDMDTAAWSIPYVEYAVTKKIINGYGDGTYGPDNPLKYNEALKMIVCALGYTTDCSEIASGTYPEVFVKKAKELGLTKGLTFNGEDGASRGDCAIMLYNALSVANVYGDLDGSTVYKPGKQQLEFNGQTVNGTSWLASLSSSGGPQYMVIGAKDLYDYALSDQVGLAAEVFTDNANHVLIIRDNSITQLMSGTISNDGTTFTSGDKTYSLSDAAMKKFTSVSDSAPTDASCLPYFYKGVLSSTIDKTRNYSGHVAVLKDGHLYLTDSTAQDADSSDSMITGSCKLTVSIEEDQITQIWAVNSTPLNSGQTTGWEIKSPTNPVVYWTLNGVEANKTLTLTLNATEEATYGTLINDNSASEHVSANPIWKLNKGNNTVTIDISKMHLTEGETAYLHLGFDTVSGAHMVTTVPFKNVNS